MSERAAVLEALYLAVDDLNVQLPPAARLAKAESTPLAGPEASLDSLGYLNFVLSAETHVDGRCGRPVGLVERLLAEEQAGRLPDTIGALATFILALQEP